MYISSIAGFGAETAQLLHYTDNKWCLEKAANSPCPRAFHSMVSVGPLLFVFGGITSKTSLTRGKVGQHTKLKVCMQHANTMLSIVYHNVYEW